MTTAKKQQILTEHYLDFFNRAVAILDDEDDAKDAVQEAVVKTLVRIGVRNPHAYCLRATVNQCMDILRHRKRLERYDDMKMLTSYDEESIVQMVEEGKSALEPLERKALEYYHEDGQAYHKVAAIMGVSVNTVRRLVARGEQKLKEQLIDKI